MAKKARKITRYRKNSNNSSKVLLIGISITLLVLAVSARSLFKSQTIASGKSLGVFLAKDGDSSGGGGGGGDSSGSSGGGGSSGSSGSSSSSDNGSSGGGSSGGSGSSDSSSGTSGTSGSSGTNSDSSSGGSSGSSGSGGSTSKIIFVNPTTGVKTEIEKQQNNDETKTEIQTGDNKVKTETKTGVAKVRFELEDGKLVVKQENENENETENELELNENQVQEVENELEKEDIKVSTEDGSLVVLRRGIGARTTLPISIDTATNSLIVTTPAGTKVVAILPDAAINNLIAKNVLSEIEGAPANAAKLTEVENHPVFEVSGTKKEKLLGLLSVSLKKKVIMNAQTAQVEQEQESLLTRLLDALSF